MSVIEAGSSFIIRLGVGWFLIVTLNFFGYGEDSSSMTAEI